MIAGQVLDVLQRHRFASPAHAMVREVRSGTGFSRKVNRYADAVVVSCFPSRGLWIAGVEVKVDVGDWRRELAEPEKAAEIQRWCHYWWVAAPVGIVESGDVPETWGLIEIEGKGRSARAVTRKDAPRLQPVAPDMPFLASLLRNAGASVDARVERARDEARQEIRNELNAGRFAELESQLYAARAEAERFKERMADVARFEKASGVCIQPWAFDASVKQFKAADALVRALRRSGADGHLADVACDLRRAAEAVDRARGAFSTAATKEAAKEEFES